MIERDEERISLNMREYREHVSDYNHFMWRANNAKASAKNSAKYVLENGGEKEYNEKIAEEFK